MRLATLSALLPMIFMSFTAGAADIKTAHALSEQECMFKPWPHHLLFDAD
jgi:hypothetical protein